jgi:hemerythrin-like domain-containing protein
MKEDNVLYHMAEEGIADDDKIALDKEYQQIEENLGKQNIWNEFEALYSNLEKCLESKMAVPAS